MTLALPLTYVKEKEYFCRLFFSFESILKLFYKIYLQIPIRRCRLAARSAQYPTGPAHRHCLGRRCFDLKQWSNIK